MAHVVAEPCYECKHTDCVVVCPVECFHEGPKMLYIHPEDCIDCEACVPECPEEAIFHEEHLPADWVPFRDLNATMARQTPPVAGRVDDAPRGGGSPKSPGGLGYTSAQDD